MSSGPSQANLSISPDRRPSHRDYRLEERDLRDEDSRALGQTNSLAPSQRIKHYASLFVAEKPLEAHREFRRKLRGEDGVTLHLEGTGSHPPGPPVSGRSLHRSPERNSYQVPSAPPSEISRVRDSATPFSQVPFSTELPPIGAQSDKYGAQDGRRTVTGDGVAGGGQDILDDVEGVASDPEYEAYRKAFKQGFLYRIVKAEILKNKRRRGRADYLSTLKTVYTSIVPSSGRRQPVQLTALDALKSYLYIASMVIFDRATPTLLGLNASLIVLLLATCMAFTTAFSAGQRRAWLEAINAASGNFLPNVEGEDNWGPKRLWRHFIQDNSQIGGDVYLSEWGGVGAVIVHTTKESWRYIVAVFVHSSMWHFLLVGGCAITAGVLVERRYGIFRTCIMTLMLCITSSMAAVLFSEKCSVSYGAGPLAWGYLMWWAVDTLARITLWPLKDPERRWKMLLAYKNLSNIILLISTTLTLFISELSLGASTGPPAVAAALSSLLIAPVIAPRWSTSRIEASTVPVALLAIVIFWIVLPISGAGTVSGITEEQVASCPLVQLVPQ